MGGSLYTIRSTKYWVNCSNPGDVPGFQREMHGLLQVRGDLPRRHTQGERRRTRDSLPRGVLALRGLHDGLPGGRGAPLTAPLDSPGHQASQIEEANLQTSIIHHWICPHARSLNRDSSHLGCCSEGIRGFESHPPHQRRTSLLSF